MTRSSAHLTASTLEEFVDELLPPARHAEVEQHLARCAECAVEVESIRALFERLAALPRFAPSEQFAAGVMARIRIAPQRHAGMAWVRRLTPSSRRAWALLSVVVSTPAFGFALLALWVVTHPLLSASALVDWALLRSQGAGQALFAWVLARTMTSAGSEWIAAVVELVRAIPLPVLTGGLLLLGLAMPLSLWGLIRLTRIPARTVVHGR